MNLYIIGNGFDLNHGLKTSYKDYMKYMWKHHRDIASSFENCEYIADDASPKDRWTDLENAMRISYEDVMQMAVGEYYPDMITERTPGWEDIAIEVENNFKFIKQFTDKCLKEWLMSIDLSNITSIRTDVDPNGYFITFNYTETLEKIYEVPENHIYHIHGKLGYNNKLQFGSIENVSDAVTENLQHRYGNDEFYNVAIAGAVDLLGTYCNDAAKNLSNNYMPLQQFLTSIPACKEEGVNIIVMGHSFAGIDSPYYRDVIVPWSTQFYRTWYFYCHSDRDKNDVNSFCRTFDVYGNMLEWS